VLVSDNRAIVRCLSLTAIHPGPPPSLPSVPILEVNCFVHDDDPRHVFPVKIARTDTVGTLKKAIKEEKKVALEHADADALKVWKVDVPVNDRFKENVGMVDLRDEEELSAVDELSDLFSEGPTRKHLHIIVVYDPPTGECEYFVQSDESEHWYLVISENRTAKETPDKGKGDEPGRDSTDALDRRTHLSSLSLTILNISCLIGLQNTISGILDALPPHHSAKSSALVKSQAAYSIYNGRYKAGSPKATAAPPVQLFHPAFAHFLDDMRKDHDIPDVIISNTTAYMKGATAVYTTEDKRREALNPLLADVLEVNIQVVQNSDKTCPDGIVEFLASIGLVAIVYEEIKNEFGDGSCDPSTQVGLSCARCLAQSRVFLYVVLHVPL
jgi:hypothetical protein